jgi:alpha-ribazole phosphatase
MNAMNRILPEKIDGTTRVYLLRHGEVDGDSIGVLYGQMDVDLSEEGRKQSEAVAERMAAEKIEAVYSSDLRRAMYLADRIAEKHGIEPVRVEALRERDFGNWQGIPFEVLRMDHARELDAYYRNYPDYPIPGGENFTKFWTRIRPAYREILDKHPGQSIVIAAHSGVTRTIIGDVLDMEFRQIFYFEQKFCCLNIIDYIPDRTQLRLLNG